MNDLVESLCHLSRLIRSVPETLPGRRVHLHEGSKAEGRSGQISVTVFDVPPDDETVGPVLESTPGCLSAIYFPSRAEMVAWFEVGAA